MRKPILKSLLDICRYVLTNRDYQSAAPSKTIYTLWRPNLELHRRSSAKGNSWHLKCTGHDEQLFKFETKQDLPRSHRWVLPFQMAYYSLVYDPKANGWRMDTGRTRGGLRFCCIWHQWVGATIRYPWDTLPSRVRSSCVRFPLSPVFPTTDSEPLNVGPTPMCFSTAVRHSDKISCALSESKNWQHSSLRPGLSHCTCRIYEWLRGDPLTLFYYIALSLWPNGLEKYSRDNVCAICYQAFEGVPTCRCLQQNPALDIPNLLWYEARLRMKKHNIELGHNRLLPEGPTRTPNHRE